MTRESFIESLDEMEKSLIYLNNGSSLSMTEKIVRANCKALWLILTWIVKRIDKEKK